MGTLEERRRYVRLDTRLRINYRVLPQSPRMENSETLDVSGGGIRIFLTEPLKAGTLLELEIFFPEQATPVRCQGRIVWVEEFAIYQGTREERKDMEAGVEFSDITPQDRDHIIKHVILGYAHKREGETS